MLISPYLTVLCFLCFNEKQDVKQIDVHAERLDKCAIVDAIHILLVKINETCYTVCVSSARNLIGYFNNVKVISHSSVYAIFKIIFSADF
jgi:hypothetical protein